MSNHTNNRIVRVLSCSEVEENSINPGTPDEEIPVYRRRGRNSYRLGLTCVAIVGYLVIPDIKKDIPVSKQKEWWLGWYDEQLRRFYGR